MGREVEEWRDVPGWPGYRVSDRGQVLSSRHFKGTSEKVLQPADNGNGYQKVVLYGSGRPRQRYIHQLVLLAFRGACPEGHNVNHINGNKADNRLANLEYVTYSDNHEHSRKVLGRTVGESHGMAKLMRQEVLFIRDCYEAGGVYQRELAEEFGVSQSTIQLIVTRKKWAHV